MKFNRITDADLEQLAEELEEDLAYVAPEAKGVRLLKYQKAFVRLLRLLEQKQFSK